MAKYQENTFLSILFDDKISVNNDKEIDILLNESSVQKLKTFYDSCYSSDLVVENIESEQLLIQYLSMVNFTNNLLPTSQMFYNLNWTENNKIGFQNAMKWLFQREWNALYKLEIYNTKIPSIYQNVGVWFGYDRNVYQELMDNMFKSQYEILFSMNSTEANMIADLVLNFNEQIANITTIDSTNWVQDNLISMAQIDEINNIFGVSDILNYSNILLNTFESTEMDIEHIMYIEGGIDYFNNLSLLIENTPPMIIQYIIFTDVMYYYMNSKESIQQDRMNDRKQFCLDLTINEFGFLYAHMLDKLIYGIEIQTEVENLCHYIIDNGVIPLINKADWLDEKSTENAIKKAENMAIYVGLPDNLRNITNLNRYYDKLNPLNKSSFITNYDKLLQFKTARMLDQFKGTTVDLISPWPSVLMSRYTSSSYSWLSSITAFYNGANNFFCMPWPIQLKPFFDINYPSSINFAAVGGVIGHEISHGFDPIGSRFNWNGTQSEIWTNYTKRNYNEKMQCFIDQYNNISLHENLSINGSNSITENTADNAGIQESYKAWRYYLNEMNGGDAMDRIKLPGFNDGFNNDKLYWIGYARTWCDIWTKYFYDDKITVRSDYYWTHSPRFARIIAVVQNNKAFSDAFECDSGTPMNPPNKCVLW
eukprot:282596_1